MLQHKPEKAIRLAAIPDFQDDQARLAVRR
jgi:hypothetical protein